MNLYLTCPPFAQTWLKTDMRYLVVCTLVKALYIEMLAETRPFVIGLGKEIRAMI